MFLHLLHKHGISKLTDLNLVEVFYGGNFFKQVSITSRSIEKWINPFSRDSHDYRDDRGYCLNEIF
jgi:hypothetical protein